MTQLPGSPRRTAKKPSPAPSRCSPPEEKDALFLALLRRANLPAPVAEYRFHKTRKWRNDWAWPTERVALEVEGGVWTRGRHTRGKGAVADMEKYNELARMGWRLIRVTPSQLATLETIELLTDCLRAA